MQIIVGIVGLIALIIIGVVVGVLVSKSHKSSTPSSPSSNKSSSTPFSKSKDANSSSNYFNSVLWSDDNDPSTFEKDSNLKNAFWAVAYTPFGSQIPACGSNLGKSA
jgi:cytoskeletal protein RodZ